MDQSLKWTHVVKYPETTVEHINPVGMGKIIIPHGDGLYFTTGEEYVLSKKLVERLQETCKLFVDGTVEFPNEDPPTLDEIIIAIENWKDKVLSQEGYKI